MTIGLIIHFFDFRADVRELIQTYQLSGHKVVLFARADEIKYLKAHPIDGVEYREIREERKIWWNRLFEYTFLLFRKLPKSKNNYFLMELFKVSNLPSLKSRRIGRLILAVQQLGIEWFSYDRLIRNLRYKGETPIGDIDEFIGFTEFPSDYLAARLLKESRPLKIYVYSWDHPCKHTRFSQYFSYKVWSDEIRQDLISLQRIPEENIKVCGSSQFSKLFDYLNSTGSRENPFGFPYIYYCCAIGITELIPQETAIIKLLAAELGKCRPDLKMIVRPYPLLQNWNLYQPLFSLENVVMDDRFRTNPFPDFTSSSFDKFRKLSSALLVLHSGSTIGLEACLLGVPSLLVDFGYGKKRSGLSVYGFIHQFQNEKYLLQQGLGLRQPSDLCHVLRNPEEIQQKSKRVATSFPLTSLLEISERLLN